MRTFLPGGSVMCAATATMSETVREAVIKSLHIQSGHADINLGNWRANLRYGVWVMDKGQNSFSEICKFFNPDVPLEDTGQALVFGEDYAAVHRLAHALCEHYGLSGQEAIDLMPVYHSLLDEETKRRTVHRFKQGRARVLFTTEALTMGADFPTVRLVLNFLSPAMLEIWLQHAGRGARLLALLCICIVLITKAQLKTAIDLCKKAKIEVNPVVLAMKTEKDAEVEAPQTQKQASPDVDRSDAGNRTMTLGMAKYIATGVAGGCVVDVINRYFSNPAHTPCLEVGGCKSCHKRRQEEDKRRMEAALVDPHREERRATRHEGQVEVSDDEEYVHKAPKKPSSDIRPPAERAKFLQAILDWRKKKLRDTIKIYNCSLNQIMTIREAERIIKFKWIASPEDFDKPEVKWPGKPEWRLEVLSILSNQQHAIELQAAQKKEDDRMKKTLERQRKADEKARLEQEKVEAERKREEETEAAQRIQPPAAANLIIPANQTPTRPRVHINEAGIPSPISPNDPLPLPRAPTTVARA
ncbi:hypothetical protein FRC09_003868 [Ceratobasidium sp. 395]|nr:hypothetical protein FRC09_003868 [Ceratobasidium sp. 395]